MNYLEVVARNVELIRVAKGYTKDDLAADAEITRSHLSNILNGQNSSLMMVAALADTLGVRLSHLVEPELEVISIPLKEAADGAPVSSQTRLHIVRDKTSRRRIRPRSDESV